jgi:beta-mannosidase
MKKTSLIVYLLLLATLGQFSCNSKKAVPVEKIDFNGEWQFSENGKNEWLPAKIPGTVHSDLYNNKKIEWPYYGKNEQDLSWIEEKEWRYKTTFNISSEQLEKDFIELVMEGVDTYADIFVNDSLVKSVENMFVACQIPCKKYLKSGNNKLEVHFKSALNITRQQLKDNKYLIPCANEYAPDSLRSNIFARKAPYHWGWDWGPRIVTCGIWRPAYLRAWNKAKLEDLQIITDSISTEKALLTANVELSAGENTDALLVLSVDGKNTAEQKIKLQKGANNQTIKFEIANPELWWTLGLGSQKLYNIELALQIDKSTVNAISRKTGVRKIELITTKDSIGNNFYFQLNGKPLFIKGSNYIPADNILTDVTEERYQKVIKATTDANMNMLRVWGGAIYENDLFYDLCDQNGILVWQDFMFACSMIPSGEKHLKKLEDEFSYNIKRLRNHASLALWCGNNENMVAWRGWGWQKEFRLNPSDSIELMDTYKKVFHDMLPKAIAQYDPTRTYWPTSPGGGFNLEDAQSPLSGDVHDWRIWFSKTPFETITSVKHRFISEYGLQSMPEMKTIRSFATEKDFKYDSELFDYKQRSKMPWIGKDENGNVFNGNDMLKTYIEMYYKKPKSFEDFVYLSQLTQAEGLKYIIHGHRAHKPYCWGSMYWQIDDCWPTVSWATMDYFYRWKAGHYFVRDAYKQVIVSATLEGKKNVSIKVLSDELNNFDGLLNVSLISFDGKILDTISMKAIVQANQSIEIFNKPISLILGKSNSKSSLLLVELIKDKKVISSDILYFDVMKNINVPKNPIIKKEMIVKDGGIEIKLSSDVLVKNLSLTTSKTEGFFSNNYFDIIPGMPQIIQFTGSNDIAAFEKELLMKSLVDTY